MDCCIGWKVKGEWCLVGVPNLAKFEPMLFPKVDNVPLKLGDFVLEIFRQFLCYVGFMADGQTVLPQKSIDPLL